MAERPQITITVSGISGVGKSTLAFLIAEALAQQYLSVDLHETVEVPKPLSPAQNALVHKTKPKITIMELRI